MVRGERREKSKKEGVGRGVRVIFKLLNNLTIFVCKVGVVDRYLRGTTKRGVGGVLSLLAEGPMVKTLTKVLIATMLRDSDTAAIVTVNFMDTKLVALPRTVSVVFNTGVNAAVATRLVTFGLDSCVCTVVFVKFVMCFVSGSRHIGGIKVAVFTFNLLFLKVRAVKSIVGPLTSDPVFARLVNGITSVPVLKITINTLVAIIIRDSDTAVTMLRGFTTRPNTSNIADVVNLTNTVPVLFNSGVKAAVATLLTDVNRPGSTGEATLTRYVFGVSKYFLFV